MQTSFHYNALYFALLIPLLSVIYFICRSYFANYDLKGNKKVLNRKLFLIALICGIAGIVMLLNITISEITDGPNISISGLDIIGDTIVQEPSTSIGYSSLMFWIEIFFYSATNVKFIFRGIALGCFIVGILGMVLAYKFNKSFFFIISLILGAASPFISTCDIEFDNAYATSISSVINPIGTILVISSVILSIYILVSNKRASKICE